MSKSFYICDYKEWKQYLVVTDNRNYISEQTTEGLKDFYLLEIINYRTKLLIQAFLYLIQLKWHPQKITC